MQKAYLYKKVYKQLKDKILSGIYQEGDLLPSENELCASHNINRSTARQALGKLEEEGYLYRHHGKGRIVKQTRKKLGLLSFKGFSQVMGSEQKHTDTRFIQKPVRKDWDEDFFYPISEKEKNAGCIYLKRIRFTEKEPVMLEETFLPNINLKKFTEQDFLNGSLFETLQVRYNIEVNSVDQDLRAIKADKEIAGHLKIKINDPVLHLYRKYGTNHPDICLYSSLYCNTANYSLGNIFT